MELASEPMVTRSNSPCLASRDFSREFRASPESHGEFAMTSVALA